MPRFLGHYLRQNYEYGYYYSQRKQGWHDCCLCLDGIAACDPCVYCGGVGVGCTNCCRTVKVADHGWKHREQGDDN